jgi:hypothetical protein
MKQKKKNTLMLINAILCYIFVGLGLFFIIAFATNLFGIMDIYISLTLQIYPNYAGQLDMSMFYVEFGFNILLYLVIGNFYLKGYKKNYRGMEYSSRLMTMAILQIFCGMLVTAIIGIVISTRMKRNAIMAMSPEKTVTETSEIPAGKLEAMAEAVERLKQLRASGVINEEEYYSNLNKILEG